MRHPILPVIFICLASLLAGSCGDDPVSPKPSRDTKNPVNNIAFDVQGNTWIGAEEGLFRADGNKLYKLETGLSKLVFNCLAYRDGHLLAATSQGVVTFDMDAKDQLSVSFILDSTNSQLPSSRIFCMGTDLLQRSWYGTARGISMYDGNVWKKNKEISLNLVILSGVQVTSMAFRAHDLHLATRGKNLVHVIFNPETDAISGASQLLGGQDQAGYNYNGDLTTDTIYCVYTSRDSSNWFGSEKGLTRNKGSNRSQDTDADFEYFLPGERVHAVLEDSYGKIWAGTENGLFVRENDSWHQYSSMDGLPGNSVVALAEQADGRIWVQTKTGMAFFRNGAISPAGLFY